MKLIFGIILIIILVLALRAGEVYTQLARYQKYWDRVNQKPMVTDGLVYVAFGDSAAQGVGASRPEKGYVGLIAKKLAESTDKPVQVINLSKSGAKVSDVLNTQLPRYKELKINQPQVITIEIGANDILTFDENKFRSDVERLMGGLPPGTVISDIPAFEGSRLGRFDDTVRKANSIMYEAARKHGLSLVGLYEQVNNNHGLKTFGGDFFHPSDYGYSSNWFPVFWEGVEKNL